MSKRSKIVFIFAAIPVVATSVIALLFARIDVKSRFIAAASEATGLDVAVNGSVSVRLFPILHVKLNELSIKNGDARIVSADTADIGLELWPLLRREVHIKEVTLRAAMIDIERGREGRFNFTTEAKTNLRDSTTPATNAIRISLDQSTLRYRNGTSEKEFKATNCKFNTDDLRLAAGVNADVMKRLSLSAHVECAEMSNNLFVGADVRFEVEGKDGLFKVAPLTMEMLDGKGSGRIDANFTDATPAYRVRYAVKQLHLDSLFKSLAPGKAGDGLLDFSTDLSMRGFNAEEMTRTANGEASLQGKDLEIAIGDLDEKLSRYESSQNFNLVDVGAFFIAGPFGAAITKGYDFANIFRGTGGKTHIRRLVSEWHVENGVALARDVAMSTEENRLAMKGALDFVHKKYEEVTVAKVDDKGCARVEQKVTGPFSKPEIAKPNVLVSLTGPIGNVIDKAKRLVGVKCAVFYDGSVSQLSAD